MPVLSGRNCIYYVRASNFILTIEKEKITINKQFQSKVQTTYAHNLKHSFFIPVKTSYIKINEKESMCAWCPHIHPNIIRM